MRIKNLAVLAALPLAMVACGGSGSGSVSTGGAIAPGASINSQFIDAPVKGLKVTKTSGDGETGDNGLFSCKAGELVTFSVNDLDIGIANCGEKIYISDLASTGDTDAAAALIQSLSKTVGGVLDLSDFNAAAFTLAAVPLTIGGIDTAISNMSADLTPLGLTQVTLANAQKHVLANLPNQGNDLVLSALSDTEYTLKLAASSSNWEGYCWEHVQVKVELESLDRGDAGGKAYRFKVNEYLAWDGTATVPTYDPGTDCNGSDNGEFQCISDPVSKIMSGRSVSGVHYESERILIGANETAICQHDNGFEFNYDTVDGVTCDTNDGIARSAATNLDLTLELGWNFNIKVSDTTLTVGFTEMALDLGAVLNADNKVTSYTQKKFNCNYSLTESLDLKKLAK